jgi:glycosyltransferase involved in cell wall biosynthesis
MRVAVLQRVCTGYRAGLFRLLSERSDLQLRLFIGSDLPNSKVRSASDLGALDVWKLPTRFLRVRGKILLDHRGLVEALREFEPDVILCEGESNLLSYLKAMWYRHRHPHVALVHWSLGGLPGEKAEPGSLKRRLKRTVQGKFDAFVAYSSYGKKALSELGHAPGRIFIATNVSDTDHHLRMAESIAVDRSQARRQLGLEDKFTVVYVGAMDPNKRLEVLMDAGACLDPDRFNLVFIGGGGIQVQLANQARARGLAHVMFPGRVVEDLLLYYRAADALALPGRGGIVISEAMAYGLPVVVWHADGTEFDLVRHRETGIRLEMGTAEELARALQCLEAQPAKAVAMGEAGQRLIRERFNQGAMADQIVAALQAAARAREARGAEASP